MHADTLAPGRFKDNTPVRLHEAVIAALEERLHGGQASFHPGTIGGRGCYELSVPASTTITQLLKNLQLPDSVDTLTRIAVNPMRQWRVPARMLDRSIPSASGLSQEELSRELRKLPGHEHSRVVNLRAHDDGKIVLEVPAATSRDTIAGPDGDKNEIRLYDLGEYQVSLPEKMICRALGIQQHERGLL